MKAEITQELVRELLHYDPETGLFTWRPRPREAFSRNQDWIRWNNRFAGKVTGSIYKSGDNYQSKKLFLLGKPRSSAQIAWIYMLGNPAPEVVDHINRNATDDRWINLRASDRGKNMLNQSLKSDNTSGHAGVTFHRKTGKWWARCQLRGERKSLGLHETKEGAAFALERFRKENGFSSGHGSRRLGK